MVNGVDQTAIRSESHFGILKDKVLFTGPRTIARTTVTVAPAGSKWPTLVQTFIFTDHAHLFAGAVTRMTEGLFDVGNKLMVSAARASNHIVVEPV